MPGIRITADLVGAKKVEQALQKVRDHLGPGTARRAELMSHIGLTALRWVDRNFASGGGGVGGWAPLRASTIFGRRGGGGSSLPLSNIGAAGLRGSFTYQATENEVVVGTAKQIAKYHQEGTGPYIIRPKKPGGVLAFFMPPQSNAASRRTRTTLVRRKVGAPRVGIVSATAARTAGLTRPSGKGDIQSMMFTRVVHHPGLPARRMLPTRDEIMPEIGKTIADWVHGVIVSSGLK